MKFIVIHNLKNKHLNYCGLCIPQENKDIINNINKINKLVRGVSESKLQKPKSHFRSSSQKRPKGSLILLL